MPKIIVGISLKDLTMKYQFLHMYMKSNAVKFVQQSVLFAGQLDLSTDKKVSLRQLSVVVQQTKMIVGETKPTDNERYSLELKLSS